MLRTKQRNVCACICVHSLINHLYQLFSCFACMYKNSNTEFWYFLIFSPYIWALLLRSFSFNGSSVLSSRTTGEDWAMDRFNGAANTIIIKQPSQQFQLSRFVPVSHISFFTLQNVYIIVSISVYKYWEWATCKFTGRPPSGQHNRSFGEMLKSVVKVSSEEDELDDGKAFVIKKESSPSTAYKGSFPSWCSVLYSRRFLYRDSFLYLQVNWGWILVENALIRRLTRRDPNIL